MGRTDPSSRWTVSLIGQNKREVTAFFANTAAATEAHDPEEANLHYLRTSQTLGPDALSFYPRFLWDTLAKNFKLLRTVWWIIGVKRKIERDPDRLAYMDRALTPVQDDDEATLDLMTKTSGVREALEHQKKVARLTHAAVA